MSNNLYIDFHILQTVPPSCINRDDVGSPKTAVYGGARRARVSSQAWKKAVRDAFKTAYKIRNMGCRTRNAVEVIADKMLSKNPSLTESKAKKQAEAALKAVGVKGENGKNVLFFMSEAQIESFAQEVMAIYKQKDLKPTDKKTALEERLNEHPSIDIMLFGRMAASNSKLNSDATCQVAHAISTHTVTGEYDYFTAVDDYPVNDKSGSGHIGTTEFNSSTLYRYATINVRELLNLAKKEKLDSNIVINAVTSFADAFIRSMPTGKQNSFANRTLPDMVYVTVRTDQPVNLSGAFEKPVVAGNEGYVGKSIDRLNQYAKKVYEDFVDVPGASWQIGSSEAALGENIKLSALDDVLTQTVQDYIQEVGN